jgi:hypothetical protein
MSHISGNVHIVLAYASAGMKNITRTLVYTLTYAIGVRCIYVSRHRSVYIRFKHGTGRRWSVAWRRGPARQKHIFYKACLKILYARTYDLYSRHTLNTLEVYARCTVLNTHTLAFQGIFVILCVWKLFHQFSYDSHTFLSYTIVNTVWQGL